MKSKICRDKKKNSYPCTLIKHNTTKTYGIEVQFHAFLNSARMEVGGYIHMPATLTIKGKPPPEAIRKKKEWAPEMVCRILRYYDTQFKVFWSVTLGSLVDMYRRFERTYCIHADFLKPLPRYLPDCMQIHPPPAPQRQ